MVELLLENGADTDIKRAGGLTPLHLAARKGRARIAKLLLESGANPHEADDKGETPADAAEKSGYKNIAELIRNWQVVTEGNNR